MNWSVKIKQSALKELSSISKPERLRIVAGIDQLALNPYRGSALKGELTGLRRIRVGSYRVIYEIRETQLIVLVVTVGHRREVYRQR
jgi:mRNA interferase RelE/StbE